MPFSDRPDLSLYAPLTFQFLLLPVGGLGLFRVLSNIFDFL